jgi:transcriptional regulator with XRE-family HTH domain
LPEKSSPGTLLREMAPRSKAHAALGNAVKALRTEQGLTQAQVAERMRVPATFLSDIERGIRNPSWSTMLSLSKALGVKPSEIVKRAE